MTPEKKRRVTNAVGFLSGVLACMDAVRGPRIFWPLGGLWEDLRHLQRVEFGAGGALIVVSMVLMSPRKRTNSGYRRNSSGGFVFWRFDR
jgi:hypothetical protein